MRTCHLCLAVACLCTTLAAQQDTSESAAEPSNIVPLRNPGFEDDENGDGQPDGWGKAIYGDGFELSRDPEQAHSGDASARLVGRENPGSRACYLQVTAPFQPSKAVRLTFWYKGSGRSDGILRFRPAPGVQVEGDQYGTHTFTCPLPKAEWTEYVFEAAVPKAAREDGLVCVEAILYQKAEGTLWYDDVSLGSLDKWQPRWTVV